MIAKYYNLTKFLFNKLPSHLILYVTSSCNAKCRHCFLVKDNFLYRSDDVKVLSLDEIVKISKNAGHVHYLSITGGEPSLRSDIHHICETFYANNQLKSITYHTNGILSSAIRNQIEQIMGLCPKLNINVSLSIDSLNNEHDSIRGRKGCLKNALETVEQLKELKRGKNPDLGININTTYSKFNKNNIDQLHSFVTETLQLPHYTCFVRGNTRCNSSTDVDVQSYEKTVCKWRNDIPSLNLYSLVSTSIRSLRPKLISQILKQQKQIMPCKAGEKLIVIASDGEIYPCEALNKPFGNLRDFNYDIKKILFSKTANEIKSTIKNGKCFCTWECVMPHNVIFNINIYPMLIREIFHNLWINSHRE